MARKRKISIYVWLLLVLVILIIVAVAVGGSSGGVEVEAEKAEKRTIVEKVAASGKIYPEVEVVVIPEIAGEIINLFVDEGDSVQKGNQLAKINPNIYEDAVARAEAAVLTAKANAANANARMKQAKAQLEQAQLQFNRQKNLFDENVVSAAEFENAQTQFNVSKEELSAAEESVNAANYQVKSAEASLKEARTNLERTTVYAPMSGIITSLNVEEGKVVGGISTFAATEMMRVSNLDKMEVQVDVSENDILRIHIGDTALIEVEAYDEREFKGIVTQISSSANQAMQLTTEQATNFTVKIQLLSSSYSDLYDPGSGRYPFLPGMSAAVEIITDRKSNVLSVPIEAVTTRTAKQLKDTTVADEDKLLEVVFRMDEEGLAQFYRVETGIQDDQYIEITEGLDDGAEVFTAPYTTVHRTLRKGDPVTVKESVDNGSDD